MDHFGKVAYGFGYIIADTLYFICGEKLVHFLALLILFFLEILLQLVYALLSSASLFHLHDFWLWIIKVEFLQGKFFKGLWINGGFSGGDYFFLSFEVGSAFEDLENV